MNLILAITSLLPYGLHAIWLNMEPIEKQMMQSVNLFTDKFLIAISLILAANSEAKIDLETAMGIWLLDENKDKVAKDVFGNDNHGEIQGGQMDPRQVWLSPEV